MTEYHDRVRQVLLDGPPLQLAILFGSRGRGAGRPDSDIDLAILPVDPALSLRDESLLVANLEHATGAPVDLVRLDHATPAPSKMQGSCGPNASTEATLLPSMATR